MRMAGILMERQVDNEIMREPDWLPGAVVKLHGVWSRVVYRVCLGEIVEIFRATAVILLWG